MRDVAAEQLEPLNRTQRLFAGVLLLLLVDVIWVVSHKYISTSVIFKMKNKTLPFLKIFILKSLAIEILNNGIVTDTINDS